MFACAPDPTHLVLTSPASVDDALKALAVHCEPKHFAGLRKAFLASLAKAPVNWDEQSLIVVQDWYSTGMAKATLVLETKDPEAVRATIKWKVPPPPVTADTASVRFAFTVQRSRVAAVEVVGRSAEIAVIKIR